MPDAVRLSECGARILIDCPRCGRHGNYMRKRLMLRFGDIELPELLERLAKCDRAPAGACEARFDVESLPDWRRRRDAPDGRPANPRPRDQ